MYSNYYYHCASCYRVYKEEEVNVVRRGCEKMGECHGKLIYSSTIWDIVCPCCGAECRLVDEEEMFDIINQQSKVIRRLERKVEALEKTGKMTQCCYSFAILHKGE